MPFTIRKTILDDVMLIQPQIFHDGRGYFFESYKKSDFTAAGIHCEFQQENNSKSARGVIRGLHFQKNPHAQAKLVRVLKGAIIDVVVDIRRGSPNYGKWLKVELSEENRTMIFVPAGFAHGFVAISEFAEIQYKVDNEYCKAAEGGIIWNDPALGIDWGAGEPILSEKDTVLLPLAGADNNFVYSKG
jgi:dTDP-4-dehydrorhamnose 3,5-epimerase